MAFQPVLHSGTTLVGVHQTLPQPHYNGPRRSVPVASLRMARTGDDNTNTAKDNSDNGSWRNGLGMPLRSRLRALRKLISKKVKPVGLAVLTAIALRRTQFTPHNVPIAHASTPLPMNIEVETESPETEAIKKFEKESLAERQRMVQLFRQKAAKIGREQGEAARKEFEREYTLKREAIERKKLEDMEKLKYTLLDEGICPFVDPEGQRRITLQKLGKDLAQVPGTQQFNEALLSKRKGAGNILDKSTHRQVVKLIVQDLKNRGDDPVVFFQKNRDQTEKIFRLPVENVESLRQKYQANMDEYGQIKAPEPGTLSFKEKQAQNPEAMKAKGEQAKEAAKKAKAEAKAAAAAEKAKAKEEMRMKKMQEKEAKAAAKAAEKKAKQEAKEAAKKAKLDGKAAAAAATAAAAAAASAAGAGASAVGSTATSAVAGTVQTPPSVHSSGSVSGTQIELGGSATASGAEADGTGTAAEAAGKDVSSQESPGGTKIIPVSAFIAVAGGGGFAFKRMQDKAAEAEMERQRQFKLIMGDGAPSSSPATSGPSVLDDLDSDVLDAETADEDDPLSLSVPPLEVEETVGTTKDVPAPKPEAPTPAEEPKKRRMGLKMFSKKSANTRETNLDKLIGQAGSAPELATTIAKVFTYGAPGRFPKVESLPGGLPMASYDADAAKTLLLSAKEAASYSAEEYVELFASVMNCMLIDIVDLASSSLKENDKITFEAINVVVDFMNHASLLFDETSMVSSDSCSFFFRSCAPSICLSVNVCGLEI